MAYPKSKDPVKTRGISLPRSVLAAADQLCEKDDKTFSQYVRGLIRADLEKAGIVVRDGGVQYTVKPKKKA
jgi:hypothetical protein